MSDYGLSAFQHRKIYKETKTYRMFVYPSMVFQHRKIYKETKTKKKKNILLYIILAQKDL